MKTRVFTTGCVVILLLFGVINFSVANSDLLQFNGHWYQRIDQAMTWTQAKTLCESSGGYLATIISQAENDFIANRLVIPGNHLAWLGATDSDSEGIWKWTTGESWAYTNWSPGQPDNGCGGAEDYLHMWFSEYPGKWNDEKVDGSCGQILMYPICEWNSNPICSSEVAAKPYTFTTGTSAKATEVNADFDTLYKNDINLNCQIQTLKAIVCQDHPTASVCQ